MSWTSCEEHNLTYRLLFLAICDANWKSDLDLVLEHDASFTTHPGSQWKSLPSTIQAIDSSMFNTFVDMRRPTPENMA